MHRSGVDSQASSRPPGNDAGSRCIGFGGQSLGISWDEPASAVVEFLFGDLPEDRRRGTEPKLLRFQGGSVPRRLYVQDRLVWKGNSPGALAAAGLDEALRLIVDPMRDGRVFHAAAVVRAGATLVMPGGSGAGKTCFCAWLLWRGFRYLTDELVSLGKGADEIDYFPRPLNVKRSGATAIKRLLGSNPVVSGALRTPIGLLVPHRLLNAEYRTEAPEVGMFLFPRFESTNAFEIRSLSKGETSRRLMACLINARNLKEHGFPETTRLARKIPGFELVYGSYAQLEDGLLPFLARELGT